MRSMVELADAGLSFAIHAWISSRSSSSFFLYHGLSCARELRRRSMRFIERKKFLDWLWRADARSLLAWASVRPIEWASCCSISIKRPGGVVLAFFRPSFDAFEDFLEYFACHDRIVAIRQFFARSARDRPRAAARLGEDHVGMSDALPGSGDQRPVGIGDFRKSSKVSSARKPNIVLLPLRAIEASSSMTLCMRLRLVVAKRTRRLSTPR